MILWKLSAPARVGILCQAIIASCSVGKSVETAPLWRVAGRFSSSVIDRAQSRGLASSRHLPSLSLPAHLTRRSSISMEILRQTLQSTAKRRTATKRRTSAKRRTGAKRLPSATPASAAKLIRPGNLARHIPQSRRRKRRRERCRADRHHRKIRLQLTKNSNPHSGILPVDLAANVRAVFAPDFAASGEAIKDA